MSGSFIFIDSECVDNLDRDVQDIILTVGFTFSKDPATLLSGLLTGLYIIAETRGLRERYLRLGARISAGDPTLNTYEKLKFEVIAIAGTRHLKQVFAWLKYFERFCTYAVEIDLSTWVFGLPAKRVQVPVSATPKPPQIFEEEEGELQGVTQALSQARV
jgi:hypothetical protein